jgi:ribosome-associated protein
MTEPAARTIQLDQFLKREGVASTGGMAKHLIQGGEVSVNGDVETRRKRKLRPGDVVALDDQEWIVDSLED